MRVAVVGAGSIGRRHIANLDELGCAVSVFDVSLSVYEGAIHPCYCDVAEYDALVVATPWASHYQWAHEAVLRGVPVFVEKPVGALRELLNWRQLAVLAEGRALPTMVGYQCRFHAVARSMRLLTPSESGFFATACDMRTWPGKHYGPLLLEASHDLDLALSMGAPPTVTEAVIEPHYVAISLGPHWRITLEDRADYRREWTVEQRGQSMSVTFNSPEALGTLMYYDEMRHFIECVREGRQTDCPLSDGVRVLEVAAQAEQLARRAA